MTKWLPTASLLLLAAQPAHGETLREAIAAAYETNPELAAARSRQEALAETPRQARAEGRLVAEAVIPQVAARFGGGSTGVGVVGATLPIWTGGRVSASIRSANGEVAAGAEAVRDIEAAILESVVAAYANLLYQQQAVEVARVGIERLERQLSEARARLDLGQATRTDVAQLEAQRASVVGNLADAEGALATVAASYRAIVGRAPVGELSAETPTPSALPATVDAARTAAGVDNPLLLRQQRTTQAAAARIDRERAERAPSLGLSGNYGYGAQRVDGDLRGYEAAARGGLTLRIPLLTGGLVASRVRQAEATYRAEQFTTEAAVREVERQVDAAWGTLAAARRRLEADVEGLAAADLALKGVRAEYGFDLRSTLDILVADQSLRSAQLAVARSRTDVLIAEAALLRATGRMTEAAFTG
jgi:outer membrane protein